MRAACRPWSVVLPALLGFLVACGAEAPTTGGRIDVGTDTAAVDAPSPVDTVSQPDGASEDTVGPSDDAADSDGRDGDGSAEDTGDADEEQGVELCESSEECESLQPCVPLDDTGTVGVCASRCELSSDCPEGFTCTLLRSTGLDFVRVCLPTTFCLDRDGDGYGVGPGCAGPDCNDADPAVNPGRRERCDGGDTSCSGAVDDDPQFGLVGDVEVRIGDGCETGFDGVCAEGRWICENGLTRCNALRTPSAQESCNGLDDTCDGRVDVHPDGSPLTRPFYRGPAGTEGVGVCASGEERCLEGAWAVAREQIVPSVETCDDLDLDCSGDPLDVDPATLASNPLHCGRCGEACAPGRVCREGMCVCPLDRLLCAETCHDPLTSPLHCGGCDIACDGGRVCDGGTCVCPFGGAYCGGLCRDPQTNGQHCGGCDIVCSGGQRCEGGLCVCPEGQILCGGICRDPETNGQHCGGCDITCTGGELCSGGTCGCPDGQTSCAGACRTLATDRAFCGACDNTCTGDQICSSGVCGCPDGRFACGDACVAEQPGTACYTNTLGTPGVGICQSGTWTCSGASVACVGQTGPRQRACNDADDDCNGVTDQACPTDLSLGDPVLSEIDSSSGSFIDARQGHCPAGRVLTGLRVRIRNCGVFTCGIYSGDRAYGWEPVCSAIGIGARVDTNVYATTLSDPQPLPRFTGDSYDASSWVTTACPAGQAMISVSYDFGEGTHLRAIQYECATVRLTGAPGAFGATFVTPNDVSVWRGNQTTGTARCANNGLLTGWRPRWHNSHAHALEIRCQEAQVTLRP